MTISDSTSIWGNVMEAGDFLKVPRVLTRLARYDARMGGELQPRHIVLLLALAGRRFKNRPLRLTWSQLGADLGVKADTVRKWGAELREAGLLSWSVHVESSGKSGHYKVIEFDLAPFVAMTRRAYERRLAAKLAREVPF
ncbi:MAG TPA: hypothetical protein PKB10_00220 [Tepidisphaeraceae bacterium]|nr:hypothetical protein [Tepidisphaeraceae bacterium]